MTFDFYAILGVGRRATPAELKQAYRRLAVTWHPDRNPGSRLAEERFKAVAEAYAVLSNPHKRHQYDLMGPDKFRHEFNREDIFKGFDPGDLFNFFGLENARDALERLFSQDKGEPAERPAGGQAPKLSEFFADFGEPDLPGGLRRSPDLSVTLSVTLREAVFGAAKVAAYNTTRGTVKISVPVPAGAVDGQKIKLAGRGPALPGTPPGNLTITLAVLPDPDFSRSGFDLLTTLALTGAELASGLKTVVKTLDGRALRLTVPPGARPGARLKVPEHGVPAGNGRGDLLITLRQAAEAPRKG